MEPLALIEQAMRFARYRAAVLASDAANAGTAGFTPRDVAPASQTVEGGVRFVAAVREVDAGGAVGAIEYAMGGIAKNGVWYRALTEQARAMLREFRTVAEESRR
jgi:hypothetical protein